MPHCGKPLFNHREWSFRQSSFCLVAYAAGGRSFCPNTQVSCVHISLLSAPRLCLQHLHIFLPSRVELASEFCRGRIGPWTVVWLPGPRRQESQESRFSLSQESLEEGLCTILLSFLEGPLLFLFSFGMGFFQKPGLPTLAFS